jgi:hypothetical protein
LQRVMNSRASLEQRPRGILFIHCSYIARNKINWLNINTTQLVLTAFFACHPTTQPPNIHPPSTLDFDLARWSLHQKPDVHNVIAEDVLYSASLRSKAMDPVQPIHAASTPNERQRMPSVVTLG